MQDGDDDLTNGFDEGFIHEEEPKAKVQESVHSEAPEAPKVKLKGSPCLPSKSEVDRHDATHCPYRSWCSACV